MRHATPIQASGDVPQRIDEPGSCRASAGSLTFCVVSELVPPPTIEPLPCGWITVLRTPLFRPHRPATRRLWCAEWRPGAPASPLHELVVGRSDNGATRAKVGLSAALVIDLAEVGIAFSLNNF